jgi:hypothetical protein
MLPGPVPFKGTRKADLAVAFLWEKFGNGTSPTVTDQHRQAMDLLASMIL